MIHSAASPNATGGDARPLLQRPQNVFLILSLIFGAAMTFITPPLQVPDEPAHLFRVWQLSEGKLLSKHYGGYVPYSVFGLMDTYNQLIYDKTYRLPWQNLVRQLHQPLHGKMVRLAEFDNTALYSPVPYLPQICGVLLARKLNWSALAVLYAGRLGTVIGYSIVGWGAIRIVPVLKWPTCVGLTAPMPMFLAASVSADPMTTAIACLAAAMALRMILSRTASSTGGAVGLGLSMVALTLCKSAYVPMALLVLLVPRQNWPHRRWWVWPGAIGLACLAALLGWSALTHPLGVHEAGGGVPPEQFRYVLLHPGSFLSNVFRSLYRSGNYTFLGAVGVMGWLDAWMPEPYLDIYAAAVVWLVLNYDAPFSLPLRVRVAGAVVLLASVVLIVFANYLVWTPVGSRYTDGLQGRYFLPLLLPFFMIFQRRGRYPIVPGWIVAGIVLTLLVAYWTLIDRYYIA